MIFSWKIRFTLSFLNDFGNIKDILSAYLDECLINFLTREDCLPNGGLPIT